MAKNLYLCPNEECRALLNPGTKIIMKAVNSRGEAGIIELSPQVGNYRVIMPDGFLEEGEMATLSCPACGESFTHSGNEDFAYIVMQQGKSSFPVVFSRTKGEHATFIIKDSEVAHYGEHADFLEIPEMGDLHSFRGPKNSLA